jgi:hypothetical protein
MKYLFSVFFILGILFSGMNLGFSSSEFDCCYTGSGVYLKPDGSCVGDDTDLTKVMEPDECTDIKNIPRSCTIDTTNYCYAPGGNKIFENSQIKDEFGSSCESFSVYPGCDGNTLPGVDNPSTVGVTGGDASSTISLSESDFLSALIEELNPICKNGGGFMGLFVNKNSCNAIELSLGNNCVFNPISGGYFNSFLDESLGIGEFERQSCIVDKALRSCSDLKIESLCDGADSGEVSKLNGTCQWINSTEFVSSAISVGVDANGLCVSKEVSEFSYFNKVEYSYMENVIKNPGFELDNPNWSGGNVVVNKAKSAHFGNNFVELTNNSILSQEIKNLYINLTYNLYFQMRSVGPNLAEGVDVFYGGKNTTGHTITLGSKYGKYINRSISFKPNSSNGLLEFKYVGEGDTIHIDSINLKISDASVPMTNGNDIFSSVNIVPAAASNCNLCFTDLGFNFCTKKKSDLLGSCSYMTTKPNLPYGFGVDLTTNLGGEIGPDTVDGVVYGNKLLSDANKWESQSLANSLLFCEMYVNKTQCINTSNYVNSEFSNYHFSTTDSLCKWSDVPSNVGCFKDSNGDDKFDTIKNYVNVAGSNIGYAKDITDGTDSLKLNVSDFQLGCDILPPETHVALSGRSPDGDAIFLALTDYYDVMGDVYLDVLATDLLLESCSTFVFNHLLYVEFMLFYEGGSFKNKTVEVSTNQYSLSSTKVNEFLVDDNGESLITGAKKLSVKIVDQSGNVGKIWDFDINIDNVGPTIDLLNKRTLDDQDDLVINLNGTINKLDEILEFKFTDDTNVSSCRYTLNGIGGVDPDFYNAFGVMPIISSGEVLHNFTLPITNSSSNGDHYQLTVQCSDIFEQNSSLNIFFRIDTDTQLSLVTPNSYYLKTRFDGFLNKKTNVTLTSTDSKLVSCALDGPTGFNNLALDLKPFTVIDYDSTLHSDLLGSDDISDLEKVIFGEIDFSVDGIYTGNYSCTDLDGNTFYEEHTYYYDIVAPEFLNFSIIKNNESMYVADDGKIYLNGDMVGSDYDLKLNLSVDGTGSWINYDLTKLHNNEFNEGSNAGGTVSITFGNEVLLNDSFDSTFIANIDVDMVMIPGRNASGQIGVKEINLVINLTDKAGNSGDGNFSFYHDSSVPKLTFSGDVVDLDVTDDLVFTQEENPNVIVSFSAPDYRKFTCDMYLKNSFGQNLGTKKSVLVNSFNFRLSDFNADTLFKSREEITIIVECVDIYGVTLGPVPPVPFTLIYDNTTLALNDIGLLGGEKIYSRLKLDHNSLSDKIYLNFNDTNERGGYSCKFKFNTKDNYYNCKTNYSSFGEIFDLTHESNTRQSNTRHIIAGFENLNNVDTSNFFCDRSILQFNDGELIHFNADTDFSTSLELEVSCMDGVGLTDNKTVTINYTYLTGGLISFDYEYYPTLNSVKFIVKSFYNYDSIKIANNKTDGTSLLLEVDTSVEQLDGTFLYTSVNYPLDGVTDGNTLDLYAIPEPNDDYLHKRLIIDTSTPFGNLTVKGLNGENEVFGANFTFNINVTDEFSGLDYVDLYVDDVLIAQFYGSAEPWYNDSFAIGHIEPSEPKFGLGGKLLNVDLSFRNTTLDTTYVFKMVVLDMVGHRFENSVSVTYADGLDLTLVDSTDDSGSLSAVVYGYGSGWLTKSSTPTLEFETSKIVTCKMSSNKGGFVLFGSESTFFSFDLSLTDGFNLSDLGGEIEFDIECSNNGSTYQFTNSLFLNDKLLDYVVVPESSFLVNEKPYVVSAQILSVGPFSKMSCGYEFDGKTFSDDINGRFSDINLNFSGLDSGIYILKLNCIDSIGNFGPNKEYSFDVQVDGPLVLDYNSLVLTSSENYESVLDGSTDLFIHSLSGVDLKFNLNKQNRVTCEYGIDPVGGVLPGVVNFFRGLFGVDRYTVVSTTPYEFTALGLSFSNPVSNLEILCYDDVGGRIKKSYSVHYAYNPLDISVQRISS